MNGGGGGGAGPGGDSDLAMDDSLVFRKSPAVSSRGTGASSVSSAAGVGSLPSSTCKWFIFSEIKNLIMLLP